MNWPTVYSIVFSYVAIDCYDKSNVLTKKTAIWARVTGASGQYVPAPQPEVIPSATNCLTQAAAQYVGGTSEKPVLLPTAGGL